MKKYIVECGFNRYAFESMDSALDFAKLALTSVENKKLSITLSVEEAEEITLDFKENEHEN